MIEIDFILDGNHFSEPVEWRGLEVLATFDNSSVQPNISLEKVTFVNEAANYIIKYIGRCKLGLNSIYMGLPVQIIAKDGSLTRTLFDGFIDFKNPSFRVISPVKVECNLKKCDSLTDLEDKLKAISFGFINSKGYFSNSDFVTIPTVHRPFDRDMQILNASIMEYVLFMQGKTMVRNAISDIGPPPLIAAIAADVIFLGIAVIQAVQITGKLLDILLPVAIN